MTKQNQTKKPLLLSGQCLSFSCNSPPGPMRGWMAPVIFIFLDKGHPTQREPGCWAPGPVPLDRGWSSTAPPYQAKNWMKKSSWLKTSVFMITHTHPGAGRQCRCGHVAAAAIPRVCPCPCPGLAWTLCPTQPRPLGLGASLGVVRPAGFTPFLPVGSAAYGQPLSPAFGPPPPPGVGRGGAARVLLSWVKAARGVVLTESRMTHGGGRR